MRKEQKDIHGPIKSKKLKELFQSFNMEFPDDPRDKSFARGILQDDILNFVDIIKSFSDGILLTTKARGSTSYPHQVCMFGIDVVYEEKEFHVVKKVSSNIMGLFMCLF